MSETNEEVKIADQVEVELPTQVGKTYETSAIEWLDGLYEQLKDVPESNHLFTEVDTGTEIKIVPLEIVREGVIRYAHYLDSFATLDVQLELLALRQARKIDREFMTEMIDELGLEKAKEIARRVNERHLKTTLTEEEETTPDNETQ